MNRSKHFLGDLLLVGVTAIWGLTFVVIKNALDTISPFFFNALRFSLATAFLGTFTLVKKQHFSKSLIKKGALVGLALFGGYSFQTFGLKFTTASNAGFITGLSVVIVPLLTWLIYKKNLTSYTWFGVITATLGLGLLSFESGLQLNLGDPLILLCAFCFAWHMILVDKYINNFSTVPFVTVQVATVALASLIIGMLIETPPKEISASMWEGLFFTAFFATFLAYLTQNWAQKFTTPTRTAIILAAEPVFTLLFATFLLKETVSGKDLIGAAFMLGGVLLVELKSETEKEI